MSDNDLMEGIPPVAPWAKVLEGQPVLFTDEQGLDREAVVTLIQGYGLVNLVYTGDNGEGGGTVARVPYGDGPLMWHFREPMADPDDGDDDDPNDGEPGEA